MICFTGFRWVAFAMSGRRRVGAVMTLRLLSYSRQSRRRHAAADHRAAEATSTSRRAIMARCDGLLRSAPPRYAADAAPPREAQFRRRSRADERQPFTARLRGSSDADFLDFARRSLLLPSTASVLS